MFSHIMTQGTTGGNKWYYASQHQFEYRTSEWVLQDDFGIVDEYSEEYDLLLEAFDMAHPTIPLTRADMERLRVVIGWLSPEGKVYHVGTMGHSDAAYDLVFEHGYKSHDDRSYGNNYELLMCKGWVGLYYGMITRDYAVPMTEAQKEVLDFLMTLNDNLEINIAEL